MHQISTASLEHVLVLISAEKSGVVADPTAAVVTMAFLTTEVAPVSGDFKTGSWETDATTDPDTYFARCLVGPGGAVQLAAGTYNVWVKIADSPEIPVLRAGYLKVV